MSKAKQSTPIPSGRVEPKKLTAEGWKRRQQKAKVKKVTQTKKETGKAA